MKKLVISSSAKVYDKLQSFIDTIKGEYQVLDKVRILDNNNFEEEYKKHHIAFYKNLLKADVYLLFNPDKDSILGYIGSASFAELNFAVCQNFLRDKKIDIYIYKMPGEKVSCYNEIKLWLDLKWIKLWSE